MQAISLSTQQADTLLTHSDVILTVISPSAKQFDNHDQARMSDLKLDGHKTEKRLVA